VIEQKNISPSNTETNKEEPNEEIFTNNDKELAIVPSVPLSSNIRDWEEDDLIVDNFYHGPSFM